MKHLDMVYLGAAVAPNRSGSPVTTTEGFLVAGMTEIVVAFADDAEGHYVRADTKVRTNYLIGGIWWSQQKTDFVNPLYNLGIVRANSEGASTGGNIVLPPGTTRIQFTRISGVDVLYYDLWAGRPADRRAQGY